MRLTKYYVMPLAFGALVVVLGLSLVLVGARSPYTHSNRAVGPDPSFLRTLQTLVGTPEPVAHQTIALDPNAALATQGSALYFGFGCVSCHGLNGQGGVFAPSIAGTDATTLKSKANSGPGGMPRFAGLTDDELAAIAAYLKTPAPGAPAPK